MNRTIIPASALAGMLAATPAAADESFTGNDLHTFCQSSTEFCAGFAGGVMHGMEIAGWGVCLPKAFMTFGQVMDVINKYLREHPEERHHPASALVAMAISTAWPDACDGKTAP